MGIMKALAIKKQESHLSATEKKFVSESEKPRVSVTPSYFNTDIPGEKPRMIFGFPKFAIDRLNRDNQLYFVSWSGNLKSYEEFREDPAFFLDKDYAEARKGNGLIEVTVEGPFDLEGFSEGHVPYSSVESLEQLKEGVDRWYAYRGPVAPHKLYLWLARKKS